MPRRSAAAQAALDAAVAAVDRELAADLEMMSMFDQTKHAFVLENGQFARHRETLARELPRSFEQLADLYARIPDTESAMERRGPAGSIRDDDRKVINDWEGDARVAQRALREEATAPRVPAWRAFLRRVTDLVKRKRTRAS